jgi:malate dehydrogenase (oxaloacetate-decarboxylating)(NADP+)
MCRDGVTPEIAKAKMRRDTTLIGAMLLRRGDADALVCGTFGTYDYHFKQVQDVVGLKKGAKLFAAMTLLLLPNRTLAITDPYVNEAPNAEEIAEIARMAAEELSRFGIEPRVALLSHSNFGSSNSASARKMRAAREILREIAPGLNCDGEMHGDAALSPAIREIVNPDSTLTGDANLVVMPNIDAANISFNLMKIANGDGVSVGPILLGADLPVHILTPSATVRRLVNITALSVVDACEQRLQAASAS